MNEIHEKQNQKMLFTADKMSFFSMFTGTLETQTGCFRSQYYMSTM